MQQLQIEEKLQLSLRRDFNFHAEHKFCVKRGRQLDLRSYCVLNHGGNLGRVSFGYTGFIYFLHLNSILYRST